MKKVLLILLCCTGFLRAQVMIFTYAFNRPDFIEIQHKTFQKFVQDEYTFIVFNDANNEQMARAINETCQKLNIVPIRIPQDIHQRAYLNRWPGEIFNHPTIRNVNAVMYSL